MNNHVAIARRAAIIGAVIGAIAGAVAAGQPVEARGPRLAPVAIEGTRVDRLPALPRMPARDLPAPGFDRTRGARPAQQSLDVPIDGFEAAGWPDSKRWPLLSDLAAVARGEPDGGALWAPSDCTATEGLRALRAADGGRACDAGYAADTASSALLSLDLSQFSSDRALALTFDVWMDADADEGLLLHYVRFDDAGNTAERRLVWSGTGHLADWVHGVSIDLTALRDRYDPSWTGDLRGRRAYLELLFLGGDGSTGSGALVDQLVLHRETAPPTPVPSATATATPPPTATTPAQDVVRTNACSASSDCVQLSVRAYVDYRCDGRLQPGVDNPLRGDPAPRVDVTAGAELLGAPLSSAGTAFFLFPRVPETSVMLAIPAGYEPCPGVDNPVIVPASAFNRGQARIDVRVKRE